MLNYVLHSVSSGSMLNYVLQCVLGFYVKLCITVYLRVLC